MLAAVRLSDVGRVRPARTPGSPDAPRVSKLPGSFFPSWFRKEVVASRPCDDVSRAIESRPRRKVNVVVFDEETSA